MGDMRQDRKRIMGGVIQAVKRTKRIKKYYEGSYTVEATFVMGVILLAMAALIQTAYAQCRQVTGNMRLQEMVEVLRHRESEMEDSLLVDAVPYRIQATKGALKVKGRVEGEGWSLDIESNLYEPEEFMRLLTLIQE